MDDEIKKIVKEIKNIKQLHQIDIQSRNLTIKRIKDKAGASVWQLERVLEIGKNIIQKA